ncbi:MAG: CAP domain-containing protein [Anaerolineaceae bacterium]|nr:CAP domain-containing protein [Anaerolineaceae bacterium]
MLRQLRVYGLFGFIFLLSACRAPVPAPTFTAPPSTALPSTPTTHPAITAIATLTPTQLSLTPTSTPSPSPASAAWGRTIDITNCRAGPSTDFLISRSLPSGQEAALLGVSPERTWWLLQPPDGSAPCWVWGPLVDIFHGDPANVPLADAPPTPTPIPQNAGGRSFTAEEYEDALFDLLNLARSQHGLPPAERNAALDAAARLHSADMTQHDFFAHLSYDGRDFNARLTEQGLYFSNGGETIYAGGDPYQAYHIWMGSDVHRNIILHPSFTSLGVGVVYVEDATYDVYVTVDFAALYMP